MKKITTILKTISIFGVFSLTFAQKAMADWLPAGDWDEPSKPNIDPEPQTFVSLIEPQHIIIGGVVLAVVIVSFIVLFKMRKK